MFPSLAGLLLLCRRWTLNWDDISPDIVVGSCPRSPADVVRLGCRGMRNKHLVCGPFTLFILKQSVPCSDSSLAPQDRLVEEAGVGAILCLQSELCHEALQIDWPEIRARAIERGIVITRVAVRDFDHNDQVRW